MPTNSDRQERRAKLRAELERVCIDVVGPNAADVDVRARNPVESWAALYSIGAMGMRVPAQFGGLEVDDVTYLEVIATIARYCAASAMTLHMHSTACEIITLLASPEQQAAMFPLAIEDGGMFASWGSEPGWSPSLRLVSETVLVPKGDAFVLNGFKYFCTMAGAATAAMVLVGIQSDDGADAPIEYGHVFVRKDQPGTTVVGEWNPLGMRGTVSPGVRFEDCEFSADAIFPGSISSGVLERLAMLPGFSAVMLGVAEGCLQATTDYLGRKRYLSEDSTMAHNPGVQSHVGDLAARLYGARVQLMDAARQWPTGKRYVLAARGKLLMTQAVLHVANECMQLIGGNAATKTLTIERAYRDLRTSSLMPPSVDRMAQIVGADQMGVGAELYKQ